MKKAVEILTLAKQDGIEIVLSKEDLHVKLPKNKDFDKSIIGKIRDNKELIISFLRNNISDTSGKLHVIERFDRNELQNVPLSFSQERLWFIDLLEGSRQYHLTSLLRLKGILNIGALEFALKTVLERHEVLRTVILEKAGKPFQKVLSTEGWKINFLKDLDFGTNQKDLDDFLLGLANVPFRLGSDYMLRASLIALNENEHLLAVTLHHIAADAWSLPIIINEVSDFYRKYNTGDLNNASSLPLQFADYAVWQRNYLNDDVLDKKLNYWKEKLKGVSPLMFPTDFTRPALKTTKGATLKTTIPLQLTQQLQQLSKKYGSSLYMTLLSAFKILLHRYSGQQDICVGASIANRSQQEIENLVGFFVNTISFRSQVTGNESFVDLLKQVRITAMEAYQHQDVPFEKVVEVVLKERDPSRSPIFQVMLVFRNTPQTPEIQLGDVTISVEELKQTLSKFDFTFFVAEGTEGLDITVEYSTDLFKKDTIKQLLTSYGPLLFSIIQDPFEKVDVLKILPEIKEQEIIAKLSHPQIDYPQQKNIVDLFQDQVSKTPHQIALVFDKETHTYFSLNARANQLARHLVSKGIKSGDLVSVYMDRGIEMMVGIWAILKAGAAYVPIDIDFPADRTSYMLSDSEVKIVLTDAKGSVLLPLTDNIEFIEADDIALDLYPDGNLDVDIQSTHLAYVIYTSGSTGKSKGVMVEHRNLVDYVYGLQQEININECRSFGLVSTIATDLGNTVIYPCLLNGGALHIFSKSAVSDGEFMQQYLNEHPIDCIKIVPSHWRALSSNGHMLLPVKLLVFGGEALQASIVESIYSFGAECRIINHYGPTETTIGTLLHQVSAADNYANTISIGKPFGNAAAYVLNSALQICPVGVSGQLFISGDGVARGYLNKKELSNEKFIENPFGLIPGQKMYATGDLVKYMADGNISFIGRVDDQVKIRGYRVELGEIENKLIQCELVNQAVVLAIADKQDNIRLIAYVLPNGNFDKEAIIEFLRFELPEYMVPSVIMQIDEMPLMANGKVDKKALPHPDTVALMSKGFVAPRYQTEQSLATLWQDILEEEKIGIHDDFFELGGHSLLAVRLISSIRNNLKVEIAISDVFDFPTIASLAEKLSKKTGKPVFPPVLKVDPKPAFIPVSFSQERIWFIDRMEGSFQYHVPAVFSIKGKPDVAALTTAFTEVMNRHQVLRSIYKEDNGQVYQIIKDEGNWNIELNEGGSLTPAALSGLILNLINKPFDLAVDNMLRVNLVTVSPIEYILVVTLHHIASDGWTRALLVNEITDLYRAHLEGKSAVLPELTLQYADYSIWQRDILEGSLMEKSLQYWRDKLQNLTPLLLPTDYARPTIQSTKGAQFHFDVEHKLSQQLLELSRQNGASLFMTLTAAFNVLMYRYSGQTDICIGTPIAGRQQAELESLMGFFVNTLALRTHINGSESFIELLKKVRKTTLEAYENQEVPFEKIVEAVVKDRDMSRTPLFQVMLVLRNTPEIPEVSLGNLKLQPLEMELANSKFEMSFYFTETDNGIQVTVEYCTDLYEKDTIKRMAGHFNNLVHSIVQSPDKGINELNMLGTLELDQLISINDTAAEFPVERSVIDLFEEQVSKSPDAIACIFEGATIKYNELNQRADILAQNLLGKGVKMETPVPIYIDRSIEMVVGLLGILKAGGAYVPIDTSYPAERISFVLSDTQAKLVVTISALSGNIPEANGLEIIEVDMLKDGSYKVEKLKVNLSPSATFLIGYTSGSTGVPKGVMLSNRNVVNRLFWMWNSFPFDVNEVCALKTSIGFIDHVWELFGPLNKGVPLVIFKQDDIIDPDLLVEKLATNRISRLILVPSLLRVLLNKLKEENLSLPLLKYWTSSGEALSTDLVNDFYKIFPDGNQTLLNIYGSSEVSADATVYVTVPKKHDEVTEKLLTHPDANIPIGKPISNCSIYILDTAENLLPVGLPGEICVAGELVAKGYFNKPELTNARFILKSYNGGQVSLIFKTGDIGRWTPDGNIEYLGRLDDQVKVRGQRVELGEIENVLMQSGLIKQAVVLALRDHDQQTKLVGYVVAENPIDKQKLIAYLQGKLPGYMVPSQWVQLDQFPLNFSGKIDKKRFPSPDTFNDDNVESIAPRNTTEQKIAAIWQDLLRLDNVSIHDNFFQVGGHSLTATRLVAGIRNALGLEIAIKDVFIHPTIAQMAGHVSGLQATEVTPPIAKAERPAHIPLSYSQERLWFIDKLEGSINYHIPIVLKLSGQLNKKALEWSIQQIILRHEVLRTVFVEEDGKAYQLVKNADDWTLPLVDGSIYNDDRQGLQKFIHQLTSRPFNLATNFMCRANLVVLNDSENVLVVTMHHIASDAWSTPIIVQEVVELYKSYQLQTKPALKNLAIQYADYAIWQRNYLQGDVLQSKLGYWKQNLQHVAPLLLPTDFTRPVIWNSKGAVANFKVDKELLSKLSTLAVNQGATLYMTLLAAFKVLLFKYTGQNDICIGTSNANRGQQETEGLIGFFVNLLALRTTINLDDDFYEVLKKVKQTALGAYQHQDVPFEKVVESVVEDRDRSRNPIFQVLFVLLNTPEIPALQLGDVTLERDFPQLDTTQFDITFFINETADGLQGNVQYSTNLFRKETIQRIILHFQKLLATLVAHPADSIGPLNLLSASEETEILTRFNGQTNFLYKKESIVSIFEKQVLETPSSNALVFQGSQITYLQLNNQANKLAHYLRTKGVGLNTIVPIAAERSMELIIGILAVLKAGAAYVPLDVDYPEERIQYMLQDANATILLATCSSVDKLKVPPGIGVILLDDDVAGIAVQPETNLEIEIPGEALAYVIYTSGSTGTPKGVLVQHNNVVSLVKDAGFYDGHKSDVLLSTGSPSFDASTFEYYSMLLNGGKLVMCNQDTLLSNDLLKNAIVENEVTTMWFTSSWFNQLADTDMEIFSTLKTILVGGEKLSEKHIQQCRAAYPNLKIINGYGPTENTTFSLTCNIEAIADNQTIPIGKPLKNRSAYILDSNLNLLPIGVPGEIHLGGEGLSRGYLNQPELTSEKFVTVTLSNGEIKTLYKTGDLGKWLPGGEIEYLGRTDDQLKIRGYRIEPGEIESAILQSGLVNQAVVAAKVDSKGTKRLVGYVVADAFEKDSLLDFLNKRLPGYMVPQLWVTLSEMPLTANGKINKKLLPDSRIDDLVKNDFIAPANEIETNLSEIWKDLLGIDEVGINDNFFDLGGDSILTIQVVSRMRKFGYEIQVTDVFTHQTISDLSKIIEENKKTGTLSEQGLLTGSFNLLPIQQWYFHHNNIDVSHFNQSVFLNIDKQISTAIISEAVKKITGYHDALRLRFVNTNGQWMQAYGVVQDNFVVEDCTSYGGPGLADAITALAIKYQKSLDIEAGDVFKVVWMQTPDNEEANRLLIVIHHLVVDGVSWRILLDDLLLQMEAIQQDKAADAGSKSSSYRQWCQAIEQYGKSASLQNQKAYWQQIIEHSYSLPVEGNLNKNATVNDFGTYSQNLEASQTTSLIHEVPKAYHTEINDILIAALAKTLCSFCNSKVIIGLEGHGREDIQKDIDTSRTIGWFTTLYPVLLSVGENKTEGQLVKSIKEQLRQIPAKGLGYGVLKYIVKQPELQGNDCWEVVFNYLGQTDNVISKSNWITAAKENSGARRSERQQVNEKISISAIVQNCMLQVNWNYSQLHFKSETIENLAINFLANLEAIISHCINVGQSGETTFTPSDYGLSKEVTIEELDKFLNKEPGDMEDILSF